MFRQGAQVQTFLTFLGGRVAVISKQVKSIHIGPPAKPIYIADDGPTLNARWAVL